MRLLNYFSADMQQWADWYKSNLQRYPEKVAYVNKLQQWATSFSPKFQAAFEAGKQAAD